MNQERIDAKKLFKEKNYTKAVELYVKVWDEDNIDKWVGWEYATSLKNLGNIDEALKVCRILYKYEPTFKYNNDLYSWTLYEKYFKNLDAKEKPKSLNHLLKVADFIVNITNQSDKSPYERTIWRVVKIYKESADLQAMLYWLKKLDVNKLSDICVKVKSNNKERELASQKEDWFYLMSKCLKEVKEYDECINMCDLALNNINKFHNDRDKWIQMEKAQCMANLGKEEDSIKLLEGILMKKNHWVIHYTIFKIKVKVGDIKGGLASAYAAALSKDPMKLKVNLYYEIGQILENNKSYEYALMHYILSRKVREENEWKVSSQLNEAIDRLKNITAINNMDIEKELNKFWTSGKLEGTEREDGYILRIMPNGRAGFIKTNIENYYFKTSSFLSHKKFIKEGTKVTFSIMDSFDIKKNKDTKEAIDILCI
ncbi:MULTISPECIES: tetratricopeptide repeat protein [Clostridium]|uniref:tetratricopeptide repeat protein n=1 Tax=Clostridium TaxID=1485 RepID=UPI001EEF2191|nr:MULTISPECIES: tetratricopeptide repeat protein [Clostridium]WRY51032.1 tetratricopeptide repeat protein [Clostridium intestinale]